MYVHDIFMELTLNINHTQAVSTQFLGHARSAEKKKEKKKRIFWSRFSQISWPKQGP